MKKLLLAITLILCLAMALVAFTSCGGDGEDDGCNHTWTAEATVDKAATCTTAGAKSVKCTICGEKKEGSDVVVPALGHEYDDGITVEATCVTDGSVTKTCATCGDVDVTPIPSSGEHTWADSATVDVEATCYVDGYKSVKCTACNEIKADSTEIIPAGHYWGLATTDVPATCTTDGVKTVKCVSCGIQQIGSEEIIPAFGHSDIATVIVPTIFSEGRIKGTCSTCGTYVNEAVGKTEVTLNAYTTTEKTPYSETANIGDALGNKTFAPGNDLYLEFSVLLNSTTDNINGEGFGYGHIAKKADPNASSAIYKEFSWFYYKPSAKWCNFKGGFEFSSTKEFTYGPTWKEYGTAEDIVVLDNYDGWHRFGVQYTQNVYENNGEFTYDVTVTVYVDGVKISQSIMDWGAMFYSAEVVDGATVYTQNPDVANYYVVCYNIASGHLIADNDPTAYFPFGDISLTVGTDFAKKVNKLDTPVEGTYVIDEETTLPANQHFEYVRPASENLYDETLDSYDYPVDEIKPADATVDYSVTSGGTKYHKYVADSNKRVAFINIKDTVFNTVTLEVAEGSKVVYSFFSKMPSKVGEVVSYAIEYRTFITATEDVTVAIPANAAYLVLYYQDNANTKYVPEKVTFSFDENALSEQLKNPCVDEFEYPIDQIKPSQGTIASKDGKYIPNFDWVTGYLSIKDCAFDQVIIEVNETTGYVGYGFLSQFPDIYDYAEFSEGWTATTYITADSAEYAGPGTKFTVDIPDDAVCLVLYWHDWDDNAAAPVMFKPASVTFTNSNPADPALQDETLDSYQYPMDKVVGTDGAIIYWGSGDDKNKYLTEADDQTVGYYKNAFINITDTVFNYVYLASNGNKKAGWAFVTDMPEVGEKVSYAGNFTTTNKFSWAVDKADTVKVEIPEGAKYLVIYYEEAGNSYLPTSITFTKEAAIGDDAYEYPMDTITPFAGYINHSGTASNNKDHYLRHKENNESYAFIDISNLDYNTVTLTGPANGEATNYTFLTKIPTEDDEKISYAIGYSDCVWYSLGNGDITVNIPANATCLAILCNYSDGTNTRPESIVFSNREDTPSNNLKDETLESYEYPMTEVNASMGTIRGTDGVFIPNRQWVTGLVSIEGCAFDKVVFEISEKYGKISYGFLTAYPTLNEQVSWAGGATGTTSANIADGATVTVDIPEDAVCMVVYWYDWDNGAPVYYIPESITFIKADDAADSEDAGTTTPGGSDSEDSENAGTTTPVNPGFGTDSDSEESENAGTTTPPIFSTPDSEESENAGTTTPPIFSTPDSEDAA